MAMKTTAARTIDARYIERARSMPASQVPEHLDSIAVSLQVALDGWRFRHAPLEDVTLCVDALAALWSVVEERAIGHA